ncbi:MAG: hypothetical protein ABI397_03290 [Candidatus Saccharimonas sp.]
MIIFTIVAFIALALAGIISAFRARRPDRFTMWLVAYLVVIVGLVQYGIATGYEQLGLNVDFYTILAMLLYNIGSLSVMLGRWLKGHHPQSRQMVYLGGALLAVSMLIIALHVDWNAPSWTLTWFTCLIAVVMIGMPTGMVLSSRLSRD